MKHDLVLTEKTVGTPHLYVLLKVQEIRNKILFTFLDSIDHKTSKLLCRPLLLIEFKGGGKTI